MITHQRPGMNLPSGSPAGLAQRVQKEPPVIVMRKNRLMTIARCHDVVKRAGKLDADAAGHVEFAGMARLSRNENAHRPRFSDIRSDEKRDRHPRAART